MKKTENYLFTVVGKHPFPIDMLRYDRCWPSLERDSWLIEHECEKPVAVNIRSLSPRLTEDRWRSFGWVLQERVDFYGSLDAALKVGK